MIRRSIALLCALAAIACEPDAARCADTIRDAGILCFPAQDITRVGHGFEPAALAVLDLDGDGALDLAAVNPARQTVSITWGGPGGLFERMTSWPIGRPVSGLAHGDFDGDGHTDLAAALPEDDGVATLYRRGPRRFVVQLHPAGGSPRALLGVDLDRDGRDELVTANLGDASVSVLRRGLADPPVTVGAGPRALAAGDLDGDGAPDLAVALADEDGVQILVNSGGRLLAGARHVVGFAPRALALGDLDDDGALDLATADELGDTVTVVLGDGAGGARETRTWPVMPQPAALALVRGADRPGLGVMSEQTSDVVVLDPLAGVVTPGTSERWAAALAAGDLDGDGADELVVGGLGSTAAALASGTGPRFVADWDAPPVIAYAAIDLDGDGRDELVVAPDDGEDLAIWRGPDDIADVTRLATGLPSGVAGIAGADLDGDDRTDLVVWGAESNDASVVVVLLQQADASFHAAAPPLALPGLEIERLRIGRVDADASRDLVISGSGSTGGLWSLANPGLGVLGPPQVIDPRAPSIWTTADLDGDPSLDLVAAYGETSTLEVYTDLGSGPPRVILVSAPVLALAAGDVDGDGAEDLVVCSARGVELLRDLATATTSTLVVPDIGCRTVDLRDLDGDGDLDAVIQTFERLQASVATGDGPMRRTLATLDNDGAGRLRLAARQTFAGPGNYARMFARSDGLGLAVSEVEQLRILRAEVGPVLREAPLAALGRAGEPDFTDLDGDGLLDWIASSGEELIAGLGTGAGDFGPAHHTILTGLVDPDVIWLGPPALADLDEDGASEAVLLGLVDNPLLALRAVTVVRVDGDGGFVGETIARIASSGDQLLVRDLDGDGHVDILLAESGEVELLLARLRGRGDGSFDPALGERLPGSYSQRGIVEIDGDGRPDLLLQADLGIMVARGQSGGFDPPRLWGPAGTHVLFGARVRDLTGDHRPDLLLATVDALVLFRATAGGFAAPRQLLGGLGPTGVAGVDFSAPTVAVTDLDGDGAEEILTIHREVPGANRLEIGRPLGDGRFVFRARDVPGGAYFGVVVRDLDDDGTPDIIVPDARGFTVVRQTP